MGYTRVVICSKTKKKRETIPKRSMSNVGKPFVIGTKRGMVSLFSQFVRQVCTVTLAAFPEEPIGNGKMFRFKTHLHRLRLWAIELVNAANPIK